MFRSSIFFALLRHGLIRHDEGIECSSLVNGVKKCFSSIL